MKISRRIVFFAVPLSAALMFAAPAAHAAGPGQQRQVQQRQVQQHSGPTAQVKPSIVPSALAGFLWSDSTGYYAYNSSDGAIAVTDDDPSAGFTQVSFAGLEGIGDTAGDVQVTPYDSTDTCAVSGWGPVGSEELIDVACYKPNGTLDTSLHEFDLTITKPTGKPSGVYDYAWINPDNKSVSLKSGFGEYNSSHKANRVVHLGTGRYEVVFPGPRSSGTHGTVEVTPYLRLSATGANCVTSSWKGTRTGEVVYVDCYSASGGRQNDEFDVVYASANNVLGLNGAVDANAIFSGRGTTGTPTESYYSNRRAAAVVAQYPVGFYSVLLPGSAGNFSDFGGNVETEAVSSKDVHCVVFEWDQEQTPDINVECYGRTGHLVSSPFALQWVVQ
jgi:hypothetical protein